MVIAVVFAGGTGVRMNSKTKPKQFLQLHGKSIVIHTLEKFEDHPMVDNIVVVCVPGWERQLKQEIKHNFITKVKWIVKGGATVQLSSYNGLKVVYDTCENPEETIILMHDGVRPLIDEKLITENIEMAKKLGSSVTVSLAMETICAVNEDGGMITGVPDRNSARIAKAPQCFFLDKLMDAHNKARSEGIDWMIDSASLMNHYGHALYTVEGSPYNVKITTPADYYIFRALYEAEENSQIFGI